MAINTRRALEILRAGFSLIPIRADGSKAPALPSFDVYMKDRPTEGEVERWFGEGKATGGALICGEVSGGLIVFDFERKDIFRDWCEAIKVYGFDLQELEAPVVSTPRGYHVYVRLKDAEPGRKLAMEPVEYETKDGRKLKAGTVIELRGQGQYVVSEGTDGSHHPMGVEATEGWKLEWGPDITETPVVSKNTFDQMVSAGLSFNAWAAKERTRTGLGRIRHGDDRPGTDYCQRGEWHELLERNQWTLLRTDRTGREIWQRPGKDERDRGGSATLGYCTTELGDALYVFSTSAYPLEEDSCYSLFAAKAMLEHGGDFQAAGRACLIDGYGKRAPEETRNMVAERIETVRALVETQPDFEVVGEEVIESWCLLSSQFKKAWNRKRQDWDEEPGRYDNFMLWFATEYTDPTQRDPVQMAISLLYQFRKKVNDREAMAFDVEYVSRKLHWILNRPTRNSEEAMATVEEAEGGDTREGRLQDLSARLGVAVSRVVQYTKDMDAPLYLFAGEEGASVFIGNWLDIGQPKKVEAAISAARIAGFGGAFSASVKNAVGWEVVRRHLYALVEVEEEDSGRRQLMAEAIVRYLETRGVVDENSDEYQMAVVQERPFESGGRLHIHGPNMKRWVSNLYHDPLTDMIGVMKSIGFESTRVHVWYESRTVGRLFWAIRRSDFEDFVQLEDLEPEAQT